MRSTSDTVAAIGLAIGGALGMAGTFVAGDALRQTLWTIDGVGIVVATALLTMKCQRPGDNSVSVGYDRDLAITNDATRQRERSLSLERQLQNLQTKPQENLLEPRVCA